MIKFKQISCGPDGTGAYRVDISLPMTVREFINEFLSEYPSEWGYIGIYKQGKIFGYPYCEYANGKLLYASMPEEYLDRQIGDVYGSGGYSRSDFKLYLAKEQTMEKTNDEYLLMNSRKTSNITHNDTVDALAYLASTARNILKPREKEACANAIRTIRKYQQLEEFARWVAEEIIDEDMWALNNLAFAELACRKLIKLGIMQESNGEYLYEVVEDGDLIRVGHIRQDIKEKNNLLKEDDNVDKT